MSEVRDDRADEAIAAALLSSYGSLDTPDFRTVAAGRGWTIPLGGGA